MTKLWKFIKTYQKEVIAAFVFIISLCIFSISYAFAAVEPVRSIVIQSEHTDYATGEEGSWQVTKSGYWTNYGEAEVTLDVDTSLMTNNQYTDIIFVLDISGSMSGNKLDRVKSDSKELISSLLSNVNNRAALITFDTSSTIVSELTNDEELLTSEIDNLQDTGSTNYYQALVNVDSLLQNYQKEDNREIIVLFLTDGYPNIDTPNQVTQYQYLKNVYPFLTINGIQYEMGNSILSPIEEISDNQFIADMETLNNVLFDASVAPVTYDTYRIIDYIDNENFTLESVNDIKVSQGTVDLTDEDGRQKITWTLDNLASGRTANLTMKLKLKEELLGQGGFYPTNENTEVISKIEEQAEDVTTSNTPILADNYQVVYDGNAPEGCSVSNIPDTYNYSVFSTIEISDQIPTCEGYQFMGWKIETKDVTRVGKDYFIMPGENVIIKAEWGKIGITKSMNGTVNDMGDPIMKSYTSSSKTDYHSSTYKSKITSIVTKDNLEIPSTAIEFWDVSEAGDGSVIAYVEDDGRGAGTYKVTIGGQGNIIASSGYYLFGGYISSNSFSSLETIDLTYLDTSQVRNMSYMFRYCSSLQSLNLSNFDTSKVTDMNSMFSACSNLTNLDLSSLDTSQVRNMSYMFSNCDGFTSFDLSSLDTSQVTDMSGMFAGCEGFTNLDLSSFDTSQVTDMNSMFYSCSKLTTLNLSNLDTSQVTDMNHMFAGCEGFISLDLRSLDTGQVTDMSYMFFECYSIISLDLSSFDTSQVTDMSLMFQYCGNLINLDLSNFNTSQVTNMGQMFYECDGLISLNVTSFNTSKVTDVHSMFKGCSGLTSLDVSGFDTGQVTTMSSMFGGCSGLTSLAVSGFDTGQVTSMSSMFSRCSSLAGLDVSGFDTGQVTNMEDMFSGCSGLTSLDVSDFNTRKVTRMAGMFGSCYGLTDISFGVNWDTSQVTDMSSMFQNCSSFINLDLSNFDTSQVTDMSWMFYNCENLVSLNLSSFDTNQVIDMERMFFNCGSLTNLDMRNATFNATSYSFMFYNNLNGINIIVKDETAKAWIEARLGDYGRTGTVTIASV